MELINFLQTLYKQVMGTNLRIYGIGSKILKDFVSSERDYLRQISRMPGCEFRLRFDDDLLEMKKILSGPLTTDGIEEDADFYEDFIVLEKQDMKKYNMQEKLHKEEKIMDSSWSKCLVARPGLEQVGLRPYTLGDFKIKKVIDKGSFGKVFLVVNKQDGKIYAMKRINKDILIDKHLIQNAKNEKDILF